MSGILSAIASNYTTTSPIPRTGLVAEYLLSTNSLDTSGNGYDGVDTNVTYSSGSAVFNGSSSGIQTTSIYDFSGAPAITMNVWCKTNNATANQLPFQIRNGGLNYDIILEFGGSIYFGVDIAGVQVQPLGGVVTTNWQMLTVIYDGASVKGYIDTVLVASQLSTGLLSNAPGAYAQIGHNGFTNFFFDGLIKKARIYDRVLNTGEIAALYAEA